MHALRHYSAHHQASRFKRIPTSNTRCAAGALPQARTPDHAISNPNAPTTNERRSPASRTMLRLYFQEVISWTNPLKSLDAPFVPPYAPVVGATPPIRPNSLSQSMNHAKVRVVKKKDTTRRRTTMMTHIVDFALVALDGIIALLTGKKRKA